MTPNLRAVPNHGGIDYLAQQLTTDHIGQQIIFRQYGVYHIGQLNNLQAGEYMTLRVGEENYTVHHNHHIKLLPKGYKWAAFNYDKEQP